MKSIIFIIMISLISTITFSQVDGFYKLNNFDNASESIVSISIINNENILITSSGEYDETKPYFWPMINRQYNITRDSVFWKAFYYREEGFGIQPNKVIKNSKGNYIITGSTRHYNAFQLNLDNGNTFVCEMENDGNILWNSNIGEQNEKDWGVDITEIDDGGYAIAGWKYRDENSIRKSAVLRKINSSGDSLWTRYFDDTPDFKDYTGKAVINGDFNSIYFIYQKYSESNAKKWFSIVHVDGHSGEIFWEKEYDMGVTNDVFNVVRNDRGNLVLGGSIRDRNEGGCFTPCIWEIDLSGNIVRQKDFLEELGCLHGEHLTPTQDGGYVVSYQDNHHPRLVKMDNDYNIEINKIYPIELYMSTKGAVQLENGKYVMAGYEGATSDYTIWIIVTDPDGELISAVNTDALSQSIEIYPNPTSDYINLRSDNVNLYKTKYNITAINGSLIREGDYNEKIKVSELSSGIYFLNLFVDGRHISSHRWVKGN